MFSNLKKANPRIPDLTFTTLLAYPADDKFIIFFLISPSKQALTLRQFAWNVSLFSEKNVSNVLLKILPRVLSVKLNFILLICNIVLVNSQKRTYSRILKSGSIYVLNVVQSK